MSKVKNIIYPFKTVTKAIEIYEINCQFLFDLIFEFAKENHTCIAGSIVEKGQGEMGRQHVVLGGIGEYLSKEIAKKTGKDTRSLVLGHLQRGGSPTTFDRLIALRFGAAAVRMIDEKNFGTMVALDPPHVKMVPLEEVIGHIKNVPVDHDTVKTAREIGISLGD